MNKIEYIDLAKNTLLNILKELMLRQDKYLISSEKLNTLKKAQAALEGFPKPIITGYIDVSANTHLEGGGLDYASFTVYAESFEIYFGFVAFKNNAMDDSSWIKIFDSKDCSEVNKLRESLEVWAEGFLLHMNGIPGRNLLIIDKSQLNDA